jgi:hypothetical protein
MVGNGQDGEELLAGATIRPQLTVKMNTPLCMDSMGAITDQGW